MRKKKKKHLMSIWVVFWRVYCRCGGGGGVGDLNDYCCLLFNKVVRNCTLSKGGFSKKMG
jgi:hypothetical protein